MALHRSFNETSLKTHSLLIPILQNNNNPYGTESGVQTSWIRYEYLMYYGGNLVV